jgi:hypothetical protein
MRSINSTLKVNGKISVAPQNFATVCVPLGGFVRSTSLLPGNPVTKGQVLAVIENQEAANAKLDITQDQINATSTWIYVLVAPFPTITDGVSFTDIQACWAGAGQGPFANLPFRMNANTLAALTALWGAPSEGAVLVESTDQFLDSVWSNKPSWGIIPFEFKSIQDKPSDFFIAS